METHAPSKVRDEEEQAARKKTDEDDKVDEASEESFPASDPPSY